MEHEIDMKINRILFFIIFIFLTLPITSLASIDLLGQYCLVQNNWKKLYSKNGITVYSQKAPDSDVLALKASAILRAPMDQVLEVLRKVGFRILMLKIQLRTFPILRPLHIVSICCLGPLLTDHCCFTTN
jgi:hypothetical protein